MNAGLKESEDSKQALRAWVQLLKTAKRIESEVASHFANQHNTSLSRFDVLANLERSPGHATGTSQLSKMLLASGATSPGCSTGWRTMRSFAANPTPATGASAKCA